MPNRVHNSFGARATRAGQLLQILIGHLGLRIGQLLEAGEGWLIFALPPAEVAIHPDASGGRHELYLLCDDIAATVEQLKASGVEFTSPITDQRWGRLTSLKVPGAGELGLYEPRHPLAR